MGAGDGVAQGQNDTHNYCHEVEKGRRRRQKRIVALWEKQQLHNDNNDEKGIRPQTFIHRHKTKAVDAVHGAER